MLKHIQIRYLWINKNIAVTRERARIIYFWKSKQLNISRKFLLKKVKFKHIF